MPKYKGQIDYAQRTITPITPEKKRTRYKSTLNLENSKVNNLKGVSVEHDLPSDHPLLFAGQTNSRGRESS